MIGNLHLLTQPEGSVPATQIKVEKDKFMSRHIVEDNTTKYVFGWDQSLRSFYLQVHDTSLADPDDNPVHWFGSDSKTVMYEVEDLVRCAQRHGLILNQEIQTRLYADKDNGV